MKFYIDELLLPFLSLESPSHGDTRESKVRLWVRDVGATLFSDVQRFASYMRKTRGRCRKERMAGQSTRYCLSTMSTMSKN